VAHKALYTLVGWFGLVGPAVAAMAIAMDANNDPNASASNTAFMIALGIAFLTLAVYVYRPLFRAPTNTD
jgi:heme/copper-type cytochrome/quinol oxidase subunit 3